LILDNLGTTKSSGYKIYSLIRKLWWNGRAILLSKSRGIHDKISVTENAAILLTFFVQIHRKRLEVSENLEYTDVILRAYKVTSLQSLVTLGMNYFWDINMSLPWEPLNIGKMAHLGDGLKSCS